MVNRKAARYVAAIFAFVLLFFFFAPPLAHILINPHSEYGAPCPVCLGIADSFLRLKRFVALVCFAVLISALCVHNSFHIVRPGRRARLSRSLVGEFVRMNN